ncbi:MAG TPA: hypothetical protein VGM29_17080, partial [Polyangiaceae bacterium]
MRREANIPLFLWVATAVLGHLMWGGGVDHGARLLRQTLDIQSFARSVQNRARGVGTPVEVALLNDDKDEPDKETEPDQKKDEPEDVKPPEEEQADRDDPAAKKTPPPPDKKLEPEKEKKDPDLKKPDDKKKPEAEKKPELKSLEPPTPAPPQLDIAHQVAVRQVVKDEHQADNPNAKFIADKANHTDEETQARVTSTDQNDANPQPSGNHSSGDQAPGDSDQTKIAQSEDRAGSHYSAPNDQPEAAQQKLAMMKAPQTAESGRTRSAAEARAQEGAASGSDHAKSSQAAQEGQKAQAASKATDPIPESLTASNGRFTVPGPRQAFVDQAERKARQEHPLPKRRSTGSSVLGYGSAGTTANGVNLNLDPTIAVAAIGHDQL